MTNKLKLAAALGLSLCSSLVMADEAATLTKNMQEGMNKYCAAAMKGDHASMHKLILSNFAPNCKFVGVDGKTMSLKEWMAAMDMNMKSMKSITKMKMTVGNVKVMGNKATAKETFMMEGTMPNMKDPKKTSKMMVMGTSTSTYEKMGGKWMVVLSKDTSQKMTIDGKPFDPSKMGG